ncbi:hypothetical protein TMES_15140 [Thalassospira mesophila]|uniref:Uncharacterized protein n=1 Tax=Thalassospira mesophila TaxID=1293891 RepID=A0A1Y2KXN7_9PROT|nr:hypothetical protein TMES_15140 [Thalassospira mesophila]
MFAKAAMLVQFSPHMTGTFAALRFAAVKTENFRRTRGIALRRGAFYIALIKGITNTNKHKCKCNQLLVTPSLNNANANAFQMILIK